MIKSFNNFWVVKLTCKVFLRLMLSHIDNSIYKISFIVLFHIDNKWQHTNRFNSNINFNRLKQIIKKMMFAWSIFDIINNVSRWIILYELLLIGLGPFEAAIVSSIASSFLSYLSINILSRYIKIFSPLKKKEIQKRKNTENG